jgi:mannose-6-phosphate isomerase-like protein (cupin superfamily)
VRKYDKGESHLFCGHWNGSPLEIGLTTLLTDIPPGEVDHRHDYHEYYVVLDGAAELEVEDSVIPLRADTVVMVEPGERHRVISVSPGGVRWVIIKERSQPASKHPCEEPPNKAIDPTGLG